MMLSSLFRLKMVRTASNENFQLRLCDCGRVSRGSGHRRHVAKVKEVVGSEAGHGERLHVQGCVACNVLRKAVVPNQQFYAAHRDCDRKDVGEEMKALLLEALTDSNIPKTVRKKSEAVKVRRIEDEGKTGEVDLDAEAEVEAAVATIENAVPAQQGALDIAWAAIFGEGEKAGEKVEGEKEEGEVIDEADSVIDGTRKRRCSFLPSVSSISSSSEGKSCYTLVASKPLATSSIKGIREQARAWDADAELAKVSQEQAHQNLLGRYRSLEATHARVLKERDTFEGKVNKLRRERVNYDEAILAQRRVEDELKRSEVERKKVKLEVTELEVALRREREERKGEQAELACLRERVAELEKRQSGEAVEIHLPVRDSCLYGRPSIARSLDETVECFLDEANNIGCIHMYVDGLLGNLKVRKRTKFAKPKKIATG